MRLHVRRGETGQFRREGEGQITARLFDKASRILPFYIYPEFDTIHRVRELCQ